MLPDDGFDARVRDLRSTVLYQPGHLDAAQREAALDGTSRDARMGAFLAKVAARAYTVTDEDIARLREAGYSEDQIFEATICSAVGAGLARLERGLNALERARP